MSRSKSYTCPNCGAPIEFQSVISVYTACSNCDSTVLRTDQDLELLGRESAPLADDLSPFQVGTQGTWEGRSFTLIGRIKLVYDGGTWSEWFAWFTDGQHGWLAEAQGFYMMSFRSEDMPHNLNPDHLQLGRKVTIGKTPYFVKDWKHVRYHSFEGELPFVFPQNYKALSIDLINRAGGFATVLYGPDGLDVHTGHYAPFSAFNFQYLQEIDGWPKLHA